jgi:hypothetical protein
VLDDPTHKTPHNDDTGHAPTLAAASTALKSTDFTLGALPDPESFEPRPQFEAVEKSAGLSILGFRPTASRRHSSSLTRSEAQSIVEAATTTTHSREVHAESTDPFALFDSPEPPTSFAAVTNSTATTTAVQNTTINHPNQPPAEAPSLSAGRSGRSIKAAVQSNTRESVASTSKQDEAPDPGTSLRSERASFLSRLSEKTQSLVRLSVPVLATVGVLAVCSIATRLIPNTMDSVFRAVTPGFIAGRASHLPPPELSVQDINLTLEKTQSKEMLPVIRGFVNNASDSTFEDVSIEALGFNARGELLVRARAPLRSALSREKISDLPLETVKKFQNALSASDASIKAGEKVAFSVALFLQDAAPHEVTYFSARVFSVGRKR